ARQCLGRVARSSRSWFMTALLRRTASSAAGTCCATSGSVCCWWTLRQAAPRRHLQAEEQRSAMNQAIVPGRSPVGPFTLRQRLMELRFPVEYASYFAMAPQLRRVYPLGPPHAILCLPGGLVGDGLTAILRWGLRGHGYDAHGWGLGRNLGANEE